ncbi:UNVERIFIED_CONTAM: hypothetical protein Sradi_1612700 [Sesamum radiatum]|uniref:Uncharacterized protein n=1 Tax=Sesamum radiatum TaxID=300843 RepID=A0AAW2UB38_SESRA
MGCLQVSHTSLAGCKPSRSIRGVTGRSLDRTVGCDLRRTCGRLGGCRPARKGANGPRAKTLTDWGLQYCSYGNFLDVWRCYPPSMKSFRGRLPREI